LVSHDMRQPCHAMSLLITLITASLAEETEGMTMDKRLLLDSQQKDMRQLRALNGTLLALVEDFLFFSKIRQNSVPLVASEVFKVAGQGGLVEEVGFAGQPLAAQKGLRFTMECNGLDDKFLFGNLKNLKRVLGNLVRFQDRQFHLYKRF
jgi:signal transduction histidine kinase